MNKEAIIQDGIMIAHDYLTATGSNYDAQLLVHNDNVYFYNQRDDKLSEWDNEDFNIENKPSYHYSVAELVEYSKQI